MKLCIISDLHLDFHKDGGASFLKDLVVPDCDLTVIAGDLSQANHWRFKQNVKEICDKSKQVLYAMGNHEYYGASITETDCRAHNLPNEFKNLTVASRAKVLTQKDIPALGDLNLLVGTLWFQDACDQEHYKNLLNDFALIEDLEPEIYRRNDRFKCLLYGIKDEPCIVVSHHLPSYSCVNPRFAGSAINRFFVGGIDDKDIENSSISLWVCGHGHDALDFKIGKTRVISNPAGYLNEMPAYYEPKAIDI
jgi:Icc-related predicted phosphoesterase